MPLVEQEQRTLQEQLSSPRLLWGSCCPSIVLYFKSLVLWFLDHCLSFYSWELYCLSFDIRLLISSLIFNLVITEMSAIDPGFGDGRNLDDGSDGSHSYVTSKEKLEVWEITTIASILMNSILFSITYFATFSSIPRPARPSNSSHLYYTYTDWYYRIIK